MKTAHEPGQSIQRVKVGMTGLAIVLLLIGLASAILRSVSHERPVGSSGSAKPDVVANIAASNDASPAGEPLAEIGVAPAGQGNAAETASAAPSGRR
ncbi:MAG: hypothetical protein ACRYFW_13535 [Janthinobacterium lividum]